MDTSGSHKKSKAHFLLGDVRAAGKRAGPGANYGGTAHHLRGGNTHSLEDNKLDLGFYASEMKPHLKCRCKFKM